MLAVPRCCDTGGCECCVAGLLPPVTVPCRACRVQVRPRQGGSPEIQAEHPKLHAAVGELLVAFHRACGSPVRLSEVRDPEMLKAISMVGTDERQEDS